MADHFLSKSQIDLGQCIRIGDDLALEAYPNLVQAIAEKAGPEAAKLFAEPLVSRGNDTAPASVSWYTDYEGAAQPVSRLSDEESTAISSEISRLLLPLRDLLDDPDIGILVSSALHVSSPSDILSVAGRPVIVNWGMLPKDGARDAQYQTTLGRFLPLAMAPPLSAAEQSTFRQTIAAEDVPDAGDTSVAGPAETSERDIMSTPLPPQEKTVVERRMPTSAWLPLVLLLLVSIGTLVWLLMPGSRIFPDRTADAVVTDEAALVAAEGVNRALEERLAELQQSLNGAQCTPDGTLLMPNGRTIEGLLPPNLQDPADQPGAVQKAAAESVLPPDPDRVRIEGATDASDLVAHLDDRTALVLTFGTQGMGSGTGFFVGPNLMVTNHHVIAEADPTRIFVTNKSLGTVHSARVLKSAGPFPQTGDDFALLRVEGVNQPTFALLDSDSTLRLKSVIAAGYPGDLLQTDAEFEKLRAGDRGAVPELALTDGTVSTEQSMNGASSVVAHSAPISSGNSGGPLVDMCGRVVGVNTFVKKGNLRNINFAISSGDLLQFLAGTDAIPEVVTQECVPQIERPIAPRTASREEPNPETRAE